MVGCQSRRRANVPGFSCMPAKKKQKKETNEVSVAKLGAFATVVAAVIGAIALVLVASLNKSPESKEKSVPTYDLSKSDFRNASLINGNVGTLNLDQSVHVTHIFQQIPTNVPPEAANIRNFGKFISEITQAALAARSNDNDKFLMHATNALTTLETEQSNTGFKQIIDTNPAYARAAYTFASMALDNTERFPERAYELAKKANEITKDEHSEFTVAVVANNLANAIRRRGGTAAEAHPYFSETAQIYENNAKFIDSFWGVTNTLKWLTRAAFNAHQSNHPEEAVRYGEAAMRVQPNEGVVRLQIFFLQSAGKTNQANKLLGQVLAKKFLLEMGIDEKALSNARYVRGLK